MGWYKDKIKEILEKRNSKNILEKINVIEKSQKNNASPGSIYYDPKTCELYIMTDKKTWVKMAGTN